MNFYKLFFYIFACLLQFHPVCKIKVSRDTKWSGQKLLKTDTQKNKILQEFGQTDTFPAYAGELLDDAVLRDTTAQSAAKNVRPAGTFGRV